MPVHQVDDNERQKQHAQQRELIGRSQELGNFHSPVPFDDSSLASPISAVAGDTPVLDSNRCDNDGIESLDTSNSTRSTRCMGRNSVLADIVSPAATA